MRRLVLIALCLPLGGCVAAVGLGANQLSDERDWRRETARRYQVPEEAVVITGLVEKRTLSTVYTATIEGRPQQCVYRALGVTCRPLPGA